MVRRSILWLPLSLGLLLVLPTWVIAGIPVRAQIMDYPGALRVVMNFGRHIGPGRAARIAQEALGGQILAVHRIGRSREPIYQVRLLISGEVQIVRIDGRTGAVLR